MKNQRVASLLLCGAMVAGLMAGCGNASAPSSAPAGDSTETASAEGGDSTETASAEGGDTAEEVTSKAEQAIADRKANGEIPVVNICFPTFTGRPEGTDRVQGLMNEYLEDTIGCHVELNITDFGSYSQQLTLMLSSGEQCDLFNTITTGYSNDVNRGYTLEIEDLLEDYGQGIVEAMGTELIETGRIGEHIYGVCNKRDIASGKGRFVVPTKYLDEMNYPYKDRLVDGETIETDLDEIDELFAQIHAAYPDAFTLCASTGTHLSNMILYDPIGNDTFGVLLDYANSLEITNLYESQEFRDLCERCYKWNKAGYFSNDVLQDSTVPQEYMKVGKGITTLANWKPGSKAEQETQLGGLEIVYFKVLGEFISSSSPTAMNWCINSACEDPVAAMQVLNALYSDPVVSTLFIRGEENVDYVIDEEGIYHYPEGMYMGTVGYGSIPWLAPNQNISGVWEGNPVDVYEATDTFNETATKSLAMGFTFDNSEVANEYTALTSVYNEYVNQLILGFIEPEEGIKELNERLYAAGLQKYMDAKQEALNAWAAEQGIQ